MINLLIDYKNQISFEKKKGTIMVVGKNSNKKGKGKYAPKRKSLGPKGDMIKPKKIGPMLAKLMLDISFVKRNDTKKIVRSI